MNIYLPEICSDYDGFSKLISLAMQTKECVFDDIEIDMSRVAWIDANMCAPLSAVLYDAQKAPIVERVRKILANPANPDSPDVPRLEAETDRLVFELYGLTEEEVGVVVGNNSFHNNMSVGNI